MKKLLLLQLLGIFSVVSIFAQADIAPHTESFDAAVLPTNWSQSATSGGPFVFGWTGFNTVGCSVAPTDHTGNGGTFAAMDHSSIDVGVILEMNDVDVAALTVPYLEFYYSMCDVGVSPINPTYVEAWDGTTWNVILTTGSTGGVWAEQSVILTGLAYSGTLIKLRFRAESGGATLDYQGDVAIDDISIIEAPTCPKPIAGSMMQAAATSSSVDLTWTGYATNYILEYGPVGFTPGTGTIVTGTGSSMATIMGLSPITAYDWYITDSCGAGDVSLPVGPAVFQTTCLAPMAGAYTVGPNVADDYATLAAAALELNNCGISAPVTISVAPGTYTESVDLLSITGSSAANTVTFDGGSAATTIVTSTGGPNNATVSFDGTQYVTFTNMTIENTKTAADAWGVFMTNNTEHVTIDNCDITLAYSTTSDRVGVLSSNLNTSASSAADNAEYITVSNCNITNGYYGIRLNGNTSGTNNTTFANGNVVENTTVDAYYYGIYLYRQDSVALTGNTITTTSSNSFMDGIYSIDISNFAFVGNDINVPDYGIYISDGNLTADGAVAGRSLFANNMVISTTDYGIYFDDVEFTDVYHNTSFAEPAMRVNDAVDLNVVNNILVSSGDYAFEDIDTAPTAGYLAFDYNIFNSGGTNLFDFGSTYADLASFQAAITTLNVNSFEGDPLFVSGSDLHLLGLLADGTAFPIPAITEDIDGDARTATPDIGADEFTPASCFPPSAITAGSLGTDSAVFSWTAGGTETAWDIEYGPVGFTPGMGTMVTATMDNPYTFTGLMPSTAYEFYINSNCGAVQSVAVGPYSFTTNCVPFVAPYMENFDAAAAGTTPPICWDNVLGGEPWLFRPSTGGTGSAPGYGVSGSVDHTTGSGNYAWIDASGNIGANELISPMIDVSGLTTPYVGYWVLSNNTNDVAQNTIELSYWDGAAWVLLNTFSGNNANWVEVAATLPAGGPLITQFKLVQVTTTVGGSAYYNDLLVDDFFVVEAPPCPGAPAALSVSNLTAVSADLHFSNTGAATNWVLEWDTSGFVQGSGTVVSLMDTFTSISGLTPVSEYQFYVRDYCGGTDSSNWAGPFTFQTPCAVYTPDYAEDFASFVPTCWEEYTDGTLATGPTGAGSGNWTADGFGNVGFTGAARLNIYGTFALSEWLVSPTFDLSAGGYQLVFDVAGTEYANTNQAVMEADDTLALVKSTDGGATWAFEKVWTAGNEPSNTGDRETFMLGTDPATVFAFYGTNGGVSAGEDNDFSVDNFIICTPVVNATPVAVSFCDGDSLVLTNGTSVFTTGMYNDTLIAASGCDSIFTYDLTVLMPSTSSVDTMVCQGTPLTLPGGTMVTVAGAYDEVYMNAVGCDSTVTYNVTMNVTTSSITEVHLCDGATYTLPSGTVVSAANTYVITETNSLGCDSLANFVVTTGMSTAETLDVSFCTGDSVMLADGSYASAAGTMMVTTMNADGCDHVITYNVTENMVGMGTMTASVCSGDSYMFDGQALTMAGVYTMMVTTANGCDSTVELTLAVLPVSSSTTNAAICEGDSYMWDGVALTAAGTYDLTATSANGCDSVATLNLVVNPTYAESMMATICAGDSYMFDGNALTAPGVYTANGMTVAGCDSVVTLTLSVDSAMDVTSTASICNGDVYTFGSQALTVSGVYTETFTNANGCEYEEELTLTVTNSVSTSEDVLLCGDQLEYTLANGTVVTEAGIYTATETNANGCENIITYNVSTCVGIFTIENNVAIVAYPNPAKDKLNVQFEERLSNDNTISILNVLGQTVYNKTNFDGLSLEVNTSELTNGVYYINVTSDNKTSVVPFTVAR